MFGIFNSHKKIGKKTGAAIKQSLMITFNVYDQLPERAFFLDLYVYGFIHGSVSLFLKFVTGDRNWDHQKKGEAYAEAIKEIDPTLGLYRFHSDNVMGEVKWQMYSENSEFKRGTQDATTLIGVTYGFIKHDDPDPTYQASLKAFKKTEGVDFNSTIDSDRAKLGGLVGSMTIQHHIKKKYIKK